MSEHSATIEWMRQPGDAGSGRYHRTHRWSFDGGFTMNASASPSIVPLPFSDASLIDPEEAFVASLASCHMLWFLAVAGGAGHVILRYADTAIATMGTAAGGRTTIREVVLRPAVVFEREDVSDDEHRRLHAAAHDRCFLANAVRCDIRIEPRCEVRNG